MEKRLTELRQRIGGKLITSSDDAYEQLRGSLFNPDAHPAVIVQVSGDEDVATAIQFAKDNKLVLSVRSGGHGGTGLSTNDGGLVIDLRLLSKIEVLNKAKGLVRIGAGAHWGDAAKELYEHGLVISSGDTSSVGVGGLTLGAGIGWMVRKFGLAIDNLLAADIVTADGKALRLSKDENPDLFWAIRGGSGNFGVVTSFEFHAQTIGDIVGGTIIYKFSELERVLQQWSAYMRTAPEELTCTVNVIGAFKPGMEPQLRLTVCYASDDEEAANKAIEPLRHIGAVLSDDVKKKPYYEMLEEVGAPGPDVKVRVHNGFIKKLDEKAVQAIAAHYGQPGAPIIQIRTLGGAMSRVPADATAFAHRDSEVLVVVPTFAPADLPQEQGEQIAAAAWAPVKPFVHGAYLNFFTDSQDETVAGAFPPATLARLQKLKAEYDPENIFDQNVNIKPAA